MLFKRFPSAASVRVRTVIAAVVVVGVAMVAASISLVFFLRSGLEDDLETSARFRTTIIVDLLSSEVAVEQIGDPQDEDEFIQVIDADGNVIFSSANMQGEPAVADLIPGEAREMQVPFEDDPFLVIASGANPRGEVVRVLVGRNLETVEESGRVVVRSLVLGLPLLLVIIGWVTWRMVGRALAPVESIRAEVEAISTTELHRRVPTLPTADEIARLAQTMNRMLDRLEEGNLRQRRFVSDASHELRNPVASIRQHAEVAIAHPERSTTSDLAEVVLAEDLRLQRLVDDLLLLAKLDEADKTARRSEVDLDDIVFEEVDRLRQSVQVSIATSDVSAGRVNGDPAQLRRLVGNLLENATRHASTGVSVTLTQGPDGAVLMVDDDGEGIPEPDRQRIFERFVRLEEARDRDSGGSGLGLAIVAEVVAAHGASIEVTEGPQGGARFVVTFPPSR